MNCIVYKQDNGILAVFFPTQETDHDEMINLGKKFVPAGKKFKVIDRSQLPTDMTYRNAWTADDAELTDGVGELLLE